MLRNSTKWCRSTQKCKSSYMHGLSGHARGSMLCNVMSYHVDVELATVPAGHTYMPCNAMQLLPRCACHRFTVLCCVLCKSNCDAVYAMGHFVADLLVALCSSNLYLLYIDFCKLPSTALSCWLSSGGVALETPCHLHNCIVLSH